MNFHHTFHQQPREALWLSVDGRTSRCRTYTDRFFGGAYIYIGMETVGEKGGKEGQSRTFSHAAFWASGSSTVSDGAAADAPSADATAKSFLPELSANSAVPASGAAGVTVAVVVVVALAVALAGAPVVAAAAAAAAASTDGKMTPSGGGVPAGGLQAP